LRIGRGFYVQNKEEVSPDTTDATSVQSQKAPEKRPAIMHEYIFRRADRVMKSYKIGLKENTLEDWWAAYQNGQPMTPSFSMRDENNVERVFIVGDGKISSRLDDCKTDRS
jgi:phenol 2-monooxygenase (NADPH)